MDILTFLEEPEAPAPEAPRPRRRRSGFVLRVQIGPELLEAIEAHQADMAERHGRSISRAAAVRTLIRQGLKRTPTSLTP